MKYILYAIIILTRAASALDVSIEDVECDPSLDVTATLQMECNGTPRCAFGSTSQISGTLYYNGVSYSGIQNNQAYVSVTLKFLTLDFKPFEMRPFPLCSGNLIQGEQSQSACPADGSYMYSIPYKLPAGGGHPVWLASGFQGKGIVQMYAEQDERMLIGECHLRLKTYVTRTEDNTFGPFVTPSAAVSLGMVSALAVLIALCCCYRRCCICRKRLYERDSVSENEALFTRMDDEKTIPKDPPTISVDVQTLPDTENPSTITDFNSPRTQKTLQMPLM